MDNTSKLWDLNRSVFLYQADKEVCEWEYSIAHQEPTSISKIIPDLRIKEL